MRHLILFSTILLLTMHAGAQSTRKTRTITTSFSKNGTISGDTTFFKYDGKGKPVFTKVMASVIMVYGKDNEPYTGRQADVIVIAYGINYKKALRGNNSLS